MKSLLYIAVFAAFCVTLPFLLIKVIAEEFREYRRLETFEVK